VCLGPLSGNKIGVQLCERGDEGDCGNDVLMIVLARVVLQVQCL
jgi:hypothetical protein